METEDKSCSGQEKPENEEVKAVIKKLHEQIRELDAQIDELVKMGIEEDMSGHIDALHDYNEMKDIGQMLLGKIALEEGCTTKDLYEEYGINLDD